MGAPVACRYMDVVSDVDAKRDVVGSAPAQHLHMDPFAHSWWVHSPCMSDIRLSSGVQAAITQ